MSAEGLMLTLEDDPPPSFRADLGQRINAFHGETVPFRVPVGLGCGCWMRMANWPVA